MRDLMVHYAPENSKTSSHSYVIKAHMRHTLAPAFVLAPFGLFSIAKGWRFRGRRSRDYHQSAN